MRITFFGELKKDKISSIMVDSHSRLLLDCGMAPDNPQQEILPDYIIPEIDAVFITHAHLDHWGYLPWLIHKGYNNKIYMTPATFDILEKFALREYFRICAKSHQKKIFYEEILQELKKKTIKKEYGERVRINNDFYVYLLPANHILGASQILVQERENKKQILYTGDINPKECPLFSSLNLNKFEENYNIKIYPEAVIIECSSIHFSEKDLELEEKKFIERINNIYRNFGSVIVPCKAIGDAQNFLIKYLDLFDNKKLENPLKIIILGSLECVNEIYLNYKKIFKNPNLIEHLKNPMIIQPLKEHIRHTYDGIEELYFEVESDLGFRLYLSTGGDILKGSSKRIYKYIKDNPKNLIIISNDLDSENCKTQKLKTNLFSLHGNFDSINKYILNIQEKTSTKYFLIHGPEKNLKIMSQNLNLKNIKNYIPKIRESYIIGEYDEY